MTEFNLDIIYISIFLLLWTIALIRHQKKHKYFNLGTFSISVFLIYGVCSLFLLLDENNTLKGLTFFPLLYLFVFERLTILPLTRYNELRYESILPTNEKLIFYTCLIYCILTTFSLPGIISNLGSGLTRLFLESTAGAELYEESAELREAVVASGHKNYPAIIAGLLDDVCFVFMFYYLTAGVRKRKIVYYMFICAIINTLGIIAGGHRGGVLSQVLTFVFTYFIFRRFLNDGVAKKIKLVGVVIIGILAGLTVLLTITRFTDELSSSGASSSALYYSGQANLVFDKYAMDNNGIRYGDRTMPVFKRMIGLDAPLTFQERRAKYPHLRVNDETFCTYVGDFVMDFGPIIGGIIMLLLTSITTQTARCKSSKIGLHHILILYIVAWVCLPGGMTLFLLSDYAGLRIVVIAFYYILLKNFSKKTIRNGKNVSIVSTSISSDARK